MLIVTVTPERDGVIDPEITTESPTAGLAEETEQEMILPCLIDSPSVKVKVRGLIGVESFINLNCASNFEVFSVEYQPRIPGGFSGEGSHDMNIMGALEFMVKLMVDKYIPVSLLKK